MFGLEVTDAGFHQLLRDAAHEESEFQNVVQKFDSELGGEARALVRALIANRANEDSKLMISLDPPDCTALDAFTICISLSAGRRRLKKRLAGVTQIVVDASAAYAIAAGLSELHQIAPQTMVGGTVSRAEMEAVYTYRMARKRAHRDAPIYEGALEFGAARPVPALRPSNRLDS